MSTLQASSQKAGLCAHCTLTDLKITWTLVKMIPPNVECQHCEFALVLEQNYPSEHKTCGNILTASFSLCEATLFAGNRPLLKAPRAACKFTFLPGFALLPPSFWPLGTDTWRCSSQFAPMVGVERSFFSAPGRVQRQGDSIRCPHEPGTSTVTLSHKAEQGRRSHFRLLRHFAHPVEEQI